MRRSLRNDLTTGRWYRRAEWDKCNICGAQYPNWPKLREHKRKHTPEEIDRSLKIRSGRHAATGRT